MRVQDNGFPFVITEREKGKVKKYTIIRNSKDLRKHRAKFSNPINIKLSDFITLVLKEERS